MPQWHVMTKNTETATQDIPLEEERKGNELECRTQQRSTGERKYIHPPGDWITERKNSLM